MKKQVEKVLKWDFLSNNKVIFAILAIFLTMYGPKFAPKLPANFREVFNSPWFRACTMFLILYYSNKNLAASLLITIIFFVTSIIINKYFIMEQFFIRYSQVPVKGQHEESPIKLPEEKVFKCNNQFKKQEINL